MRAQRGQSTGEYILLVTAVTLVIILFTTSKGQFSFQNGLNQLYNQSTQEMLNTASYLQVNAINAT